MDDFEDVTLDGRFGGPDGEMNLLAITELLGYGTSEGACKGARTKGYSVRERCGGSPVGRSSGVRHELKVGQYGDAFVVLRSSEGDRIGRVEITPGRGRSSTLWEPSDPSSSSPPKYWTLNRPHVSDKYKGQGYGMRLYYAAFRSVWELGGQQFQSHEWEARSKSSRKTWERLEKQLPGIVKRVGRGDDMVHEVDLVKWFGRPSRKDVSSRWREFVKRQ